MSDIVELLHKQAAEIAAAGRNGWGNTMADAADEIERLCKKLNAALVVCRSAARVVDSPAYQGVSDEDCDLETSVRNWQGLK